MRLVAACLVLLALAPAALAACRGDNMLEALARSDPAAHAEIIGRAEATPNGEGRFWRVDRAGVAPSHLFGTFHTEQAVATVPDAAWAALDAARIALFEVSAAEQEAMRARLAADPAFAFDAAAPPLGHGLDPADFGAIAGALAARGIPLERAGRMRPWMLYSLLAVPACHLRAQAAGAVALDAAMIARAAKAGIPHAGLESYEEAVAAFGGVPPPRLLAMLVESVGLFEREEDIFRTHLDLYAAGRIAAIDAFARWLSASPPSGPEAAALYDELMAALIDARNHAWLGALEAELARGGAFAAVGALHLPGAEGLVELLRARGWTVTRVD